jgi:putative tricarboxylic transport membrane protein
MPQRYLQASIILFCLIGAYTLRQNTFDIFSMIAFAILGYGLKKLDWPTVPLVIALILGPLLERSLRAGLELSDGDMSVFVTTPISAVLLCMTLSVLTWALWRAARPQRSHSSLLPPVGDPGLPGTTNT